LHVAKELMIPIDFPIDVAAALTRAQQPREYLAVRASELAVKPDIQIV
jgi:hypothetical protein